MQQKLPQRIIFIPGLFKKNDVLNGKKKMERKFKIKTILFTIWKKNKCAVNGTTEVIPTT